jgi:hypothetical protein
MPFSSTHVKLQLLPKSILMASCCAEEMLIANCKTTSFFGPCSFRHSRLCNFNGVEGGLDGGRTYFLMMMLLFYVLCWPVSRCGAPLVCCLVSCFACWLVCDFTLLYYCSTPLVGRPPSIGQFHASLMHKRKAARLRPLRTREDHTSTPRTPSSPCSYIHTKAHEDVQFCGSSL